MKKKNKYQKSELTSKERKALRADEPAPKPEPTEDEITAKKKSTRIVAAVLAVVAVIVIFLGVFIPTYMSTQYMFESNPVAVIKMHTEDETYTLKYELFEDECPAGVTNFCYLASIGFFDGTVIYDTQNKRVRFGGYEKQKDDKGNDKYVHRANNEEFVTAHLDDFDLIANPDRVTENNHSKLFKYSLKNDNTKLNEYDKLFTLNASTYSGTMAATVFQIFGDADTVGDSNRNKDVLTNASGGSTRTYSVYPIGQPLKDDKKTCEAINAILNLKTVDTKVNTYYLPPEKTVTIESVKIYNFGEKNKWNNLQYEHGYESYMIEKFGSGVFYSWNKTV